MTDEVSVPAEPVPTFEAQVEQSVETPAPEIHTESAVEPVPPVSEVEIALPTESSPEIIEPVLEPESAPAENDGFTKPVIETEVTEPSPSLPAESPPISAPTPQTSSSTPPAPPPLVPPGIRERRFAALEKRIAKKRARLEKVVALARERGKITNNDVQILLSVSDTTATNYLNQLVIAGRLKRSGKAEKPSYEPV